jgi:hypothetical protein
MAVAPAVPTAGTGSSQLKDVGQLSYNGIVFTSLYNSKVSGVAVLDDAGWTTKYVEWTITVDGVVTLPAGAATTDAAWVALRQQLDACAGTLTYSGKGFGPLIVNTPDGKGIRDVAFGPIPKTLEFTPLGGSRAASIRWVVVTRITEIAPFSLGAGAVSNAGIVLQFNYDTTTTYDADGYSTISYKGTLEIPLTRSSAATRFITTTVDALRKKFLDSPVDLTRFRVLKRTFDYSRDRRICRFEYVIEELPPMGMPPGCTTARGTFSVRNENQGPGLVRWRCALSATYIVKKSFPRELANLAFVGMLLYRMDESRNGTDATPTASPAPGPAASPSIPGSVGAAPMPAASTPAPIFSEIGFTLKSFASVTTPTSARTIIRSYSVDEGIYLDSKTVTFQASWTLITTWAGLLAASGVWKDGGFTNRANWKASVADIMGWRGNFIDKIDPGAEAIVDFGGGSPGIAGIIT